MITITYEVNKKKGQNKGPIILSLVWLIFIRIFHKDKVDITPEMTQYSNNLVIPDEFINSKIYVIRDKKVMLDEDLAELYDVETRRLNEQVKRNKERFPVDFMFQLTKEEFENLKSQFATSSWGGRRKLPHAFTEQGVAMLSGVLHSKRTLW